MDSQLITVEGEVGGGEGGLAATAGRSGVEAGALRDRDARELFRDSRVNSDCVL